MGYYSEVAICFNDVAGKLFEQALKDDGLEDEGDGGPLCQCFKSCSNIQSVTEKEHGTTTVLHWEWEKWNMAYPDVLAMEQFLSKLDDIEGAEFLKIRIGEEYGDIEREGMINHNPFNMMVQCSINIVHPGELE